MSEQAKDITPQEAREAVAAGALLLDVRRADEIAERHIPGSTWILLDELQARVAELPRDRQIVVQCKSGGRSLRAANWLLGQGFDAVNMAGGIDEWQQLGLPVEPGNPN